MTGSPEIDRMKTLWRTMRQLSEGGMPSSDCVEWAVTACRARRERGMGVVEFEVRMRSYAKVSQGGASV